MNDVRLMAIDLSKDVPCMFASHSFFDVIMFMVVFESGMCCRSIDHIVEASSICTVQLIGHLLELVDVSLHSFAVKCCTSLHEGAHACHLLEGFFLILRNHISIRLSALLPILLLKLDEFVKFEFELSSLRVECIVGYKQIDVPFLTI